MDDLIRKIKENIDYHDFYSRFLRLKRVGSTHMSICPFHADSQPSLSVDLERGLWYCFGCNKGGDVFNFVMEMESCSFTESVRFLAEFLSIEIDKEKIERLETSIDYELYKILLGFYHNVLIKSSISSKARDYLIGRGIESYVWQYFKLGYSPKNIENIKLFCQKKGINFEKLLKYGIVYKKGDVLYEILANRIVIPIFSPTGKVLGFAGRSIDDSSPKYINTIGLNKSSTLYGIDVLKSRIRSSSSAFVVEGYFDVWALFLAGYENVIGLMDTSFSPIQIDILKRYCREVILMLDFDRAGKDATINLIIKLVSSNFSVKIANIDGQKDPHDMYLSGKLSNISYKTDLEYIIDFYINQVDVYERQRVLEKYVLPFFNSINSKMVKQEYMRRFCLETSIRYKYLKQMLIKGFKYTEQSVTNQDTSTFLLVISIFNFDLFQKYSRDFDISWFEGKEVDMKLYKYLVECMDRGVVPGQQIIHQLELDDILKKIAKLTVDLDKESTESYFLSLLNKMKRKYLVNNIKKLIKEGEYSKLKEIQEKIKHLENK